MEQERQMILKDDIRQKQLLEQMDLFGDIVSRNYLCFLDECEIIPLDRDKKSSPIRWYSVTKIVLEKNTFFPDKLSMLYMSLHNVARNVILVVNKDEHGKIALFLGARDFSADPQLGELNVSSEILDAGLHGYLPGIKTTVISSKDVLGNRYEKCFVSSVSGLASLRDNKKQNFVQSIDRLIDATSQIPMFTAFFIADNVSNGEAQQMIAAFNDMHNHLSPLAETQLTISESNTAGTSHTISENFSKSISKSLSHTITNSEGFNEGTTKTTGKSGGTSINKSTHLLRSLWSGIVGGKTGTGTNEGWTESDAFQTGHSTQKAVADQTGETNQEQKGGGTTDGTNESITRGENRQVTFKNNHVKCYLEVLDTEIKRLRTGVPFGLWSTAAYFVASDGTTAETLANLYRGCIMGEESSSESYGINVWREQRQTALLTEYLHKGLLPRYNYKGINVSAGSVVTSKELAIHLSLPQTSVPGILVREEQSFGRNVMTEDDMTSSIGIGVVKHLGEEYEDEKVPLSINGLAKHTFVTGTTGSGKSNTLYLLVSKLKECKVEKTEEKIEEKIKFLVIEPAKGEYKQVFGLEEGVDVYGSNPRLTKILYINPFEFPESIDVYEHIDALVDIFNACWPMYAAMPQVLKHSIIEAYKACGWNLERSYNPNGVFPTVEDVLDSLKEYINSSEYSSETKGDYKGSLETRLQSLCDGIVGRMFNGRAIPDEKLFNENVIIDISGLKSSETKALLMGLLVLKLNEFRNSEQKGMNLPLRHVTVLEEAHNLLKRTTTVQSAESSNVAGMAVEKISNSMAEMRTYGEGFIIVDQSPSMLDLSAIRNTNTKIVMALPEKDDREVAGKSLGLDDKHIEEISRLKTGEAVVYQTGWEEAVKTKVEYYDYKKKSKGWNYTPSSDSDSEEDESMQKVLSLLYEMYTRGDDFSRPLLFSLLEKAHISGGRLCKIKEKVNSITIPAPEDIAFMFTTIIGTEIYESARTITDIDVFNASISKTLLNRIGSGNKDKIATFLDMYIRGCSAMSARASYDGWLQMSNKKN